VFGMLHGSYGTLALLTRLVFRLIPAKPYVRMEYRRLGDLESFHAALLERCRADDYDFVDGIIHGPRDFVLCLGRFVDDPPYVNGYRWLNVYYKSTRRRDEDFLTTADYCFRYDAECHWLTRTIPPLEWRLVRLLAGRWLLGSTNIIRATKRLEPVLARVQRRPDVVCDVFIPSRRFPDFFEWYERDFDFWPLWIVPYRPAEIYPWVGEEHGRRLEGELLIDCAIYGKPNGDPALDYSALLEDKTFEMEGLKTLISRNHYSADRFWTVYNRDHYETVKQRLDPHGVFPDLFETFHEVE